jgi:cytochrome c peroxidase
MLQRSNRRLTLAVIFIVYFCLSASVSSIVFANNSTAYEWNIPSWLPKPDIPIDNPMTTAKVELGRHLFYEQRLSINQKFSCGSCHIQAQAFTDGKTVAIGATGEAHPRNSMSLANVAYNSVFTWANPLITSLETQLLIPIFGEHPIEMGMAGKEQEILAMLQNDQYYRQMFALAFGGGKNSITINHLAKAIAAFERTLISFNSPYDRYRYGGDTNAISASAKRGEALFNSERLECFHCHGGINFSDSIKHERLAFAEIAFHNTGLYNLDDQGAYPPNNTGVYEITHQPSDMGRFKAPTLRNIALTAPYMHDGSISTLEAVIDHYAVGGRTIDSGNYAGVGRDNPWKSQFVSGFQLTQAEKQDLLSFLQSLTDESLMKNPAFANPHNPS